MHAHLVLCQIRSNAYWILMLYILLLLLMMLPLLLLLCYKRNLHLCYERNLRKEALSERIC